MLNRVRFSVVFMAFVGLVLLTGKAALAQSQFSSIVAFGDSLSDNGNVFRATNNFSPALPYVDGHFSNGKTWVEQFATLINAPLIDNAYGGAETGTQNPGSGIFAGLPGIQTQVNSYLSSVNGTITDKNALFTLWGGANDYLDGQTNSATPVSNLTSEINQLANAGAKNILVVNLPDLGALPGYFGSAALTTLTNAHNAGLQTSVSQIQAARPTLNLRLLDVNSVLNRVIANPGAYGFTNVTQNYVSNANDTAPSVGAQVVGTGGDPNKYLFFDEVHPSEAGHYLIAQAAVATIATPEANTALLFVLGVAVGGAIIVRRRAVS